MSLFLVETAFRASCVMAAAAVGDILLRRRTSAASRHLVWTLAVAGLLVLPILSASLPRWNVAIPVATSTAGQTAPVVEATRPSRVAAPESSAEANAARVDATVAGAAVGVPDGVRVWLELAVVLLGLYAAGVVLLLIRLAYERWSVDRLARRAGDVRDPDWTALLRDCAADMGVRRPVRLLRSLDRSMPMAFGIWHPAILIPSVADTWSVDRRRAVLLHELAHIARHDCFTQLMAAVSCALYWIHPGAWWIARRLRVERELACDDRVLKAGTHAGEYAEHLLELAYTMGGYRAPALVVSMARPRQVEGRMLAVLDAARNRTAPAFRGRLAAVAITAALLLPLASVRAMVVPGVGAPGEQATKPGADAPDASARAITGKGVAGTWEVRATQTGSLVHLKLSESASSSHGSTIHVDRLEGLRPALLSGTGGAAAFSIRRDAGVFTFEGTFRSGVGAGTYTFAPSASFPGELAKRGLARPTAADQYLLAREDIGFAFLDELTAQRYARPDLAQLLRAAQHGVDLGFVREMGALGYRLGQIDALITQRDHGVSPQFIRELGAQGLTGLTADDLVRARDHGVSPQYVGDFRALGYTGLSLDALVAARDHGISADYVRALRQMGYQLTLAELTAARDHGVSPEYVGGLTALGYQRVPLDALIGARDHGVSPEYVRALRDVGYQLTLAQLTRARDHGVSAEYVRELKAQGHDGLTFDELIALRDRGTMPQQVTKRLEAVSLFDMVRDLHNRVFRAVHRWLSS